VTLLSALILAVVVVGGTLVIAGAVLRARCPAWFCVLVGIVVARVMGSLIEMLVQ